MTLAHRQDNPLQLVSAFVARQGLSTGEKALSDIPTVAEVRRFRRLLPQVWGTLQKNEKQELYEAVETMLTKPTPFGEVLRVLPQTISATIALTKHEGAKGAREYAQAISVEMQAFQQEVVSLWENEQPEFQTRLAVATAKTQEKRGLQIQTRQDVRAALDELF